jgi:hypothetical protein
MPKKSILVIALCLSFGSTSYAFDKLKELNESYEALPDEEKYALINVGVVTPILLLLALAMNATPASSENLNVAVNESRSSWLDIFNMDYKFVIATLVAEELIADN